MQPAPSEGRVAEFFDESVFSVMAADVEGEPMAWTLPTLEAVTLGAVNVPFPGVDFEEDELALRAPKPI